MERQEVYFIYGYTAIGKFEIPVAKSLSTIEEAIEIAFGYINNPNYSKLDIVSNLQDNCISMKTNYPNPACVYKIYGRNAYMMLESIHTKGTITSLEELYETVDNLRNDIRYYQYEVIRSCSLGDENLGKDFVFPTNYSYEQVREQAEKERLKKEQTQIAKEVNKASKKSDKVILFSERQRVLKESSVKAIANVSPRPNKKVKLDKQNSKTKKAKFNTSKSQEKTRQKTKQKYLAMGGRR